MSIKRTTPDIVEWAQERVDRLDTTHGSKPTADGPGEFLCPDCHRKCTRSTTTGIEYGHNRSHAGKGNEECPRRPDGVDPNSCFNGQEGSA